MTTEETKQLEQEIQRGLAVPADHPVWVAVNRKIDYLLHEMELPAALAPNQTADNRALNNGRAAMLMDLKESLLADFQASRTPVEPGKIPRVKK